MNNFHIKRQYPSGLFTDVGARAWYYDNVKMAYELELMQGTGRNVFNPRGNLTIAQTITLASRLNSIYYTGTENFVQSGVWYQTYVNYAIRAGIISRGQFTNYNRAATRAEFALILAKALPVEAMSAINRVDEGTIPDVRSFDIAKDSIYHLYRAGILTGSDQLRNFNPSSFITRAEASAVVTRMARQNLRISFIMPTVY